MGLFVSLLDDSETEYISALEAAVALAISSAKFEVGKNSANVEGQSIGSYGNLHLLRGYAAHLEHEGQPPSTELQSANYPLLRKIYDGDTQSKKFQHLIEHSDSDGCYLPIDFAEPFPLVIDETIESCGSTFQLLNELNEIGPSLFGSSYNELKGPEVFWKLDEFDPFVVEKMVWTRLRWIVRNANKYKLVVSFS